MMLFNSESKIQKYDTALNVMQEFCALRVLFYDRRKQYLLGKLTVEKLILENQCKFLDQVCKNKLKVAKKKKSVLINELNSKKFQTMEKIQKIGTKSFVDFRFRFCDCSFRRANTWIPLSQVLMFLTTQ